MNTQFSRRCLLKRLPFPQLTLWICGQNRIAVCIWRRVCVLYSAPLVWVSISVHFSFLWLCSVGGVGSCDPSSLPLWFRIASPILSLPDFHINIRLFLLVLWRTWLAFWWRLNSTSRRLLVSLPFNDLNSANSQIGKSFRILVSYSISSVFWNFNWRGLSFTSFVRLTLRYLLIYFGSYYEWNCLFHFFLR